ncbi:hypothetical protein TWF694_000476 [Orbilia ellipsospora]|uniref:Uncharacterized protein n=1 Tax=Orbilia ellipsospora TaxID=2528407 RepID=A0AAV9XS25_9PEZI
MATAYMPATQIPMMGQPTTTYEIDPITGQAYPTNCVSAPGQQIFLTSGHPVQLLPGSSGTGFPQLRFQNPAPNGYMHTPPNLLHMQYAGDIHAPHAPPAYAEMDPSRFQQQRSRRSSFSMNFPGQFNNIQAPQMSPSMDYAYVDSCMLCRINHPGPHPHGANMNMHEYPPMGGPMGGSMGGPMGGSMGGPRYMAMDDNMVTSNKMRSGGYGAGYERPMYDPMDGGYRGRRPEVWDSNRPRPPPSRSRQRSGSQGPGNRSGRLGLPFNNNSNPQVYEVHTDDDSDDENMSRGRSNNNYSTTNLHRGQSTTRGRSVSRPRGHAPSTNSYSM